MSHRRRSAFTLAIITTLWMGTAPVAQLRYPPLSSAGRQIRVEMHLIPEVSTGPLDPAWSPDGQWIAFSMRGDIWKIPATGGEAVALTQGPGYFFEPAWSPDGTKLAVSMDIGGNFDLGLVSADGGRVERVTTHPHIDIEPAWSADGKSLFFVTGRSGGLDIYRVDLATHAETPVVDTPGDKMQPAVSPDGRALAFVGPVPGRLGTGGLWIKPLPDGPAKLVRYEETNYCAKPTWTRDGSALVYVSDEGGSNDVAIVPAAGGNPVRLTWDPRDEYAPSVSPDGSTIAFVSNRTGPTTLHTVPIAGGTWSDLAIGSRRPRRAAGRLRGRVIDASGHVTDARVGLTASDGRAYTPERQFQRVISVSETHYFASSGTFEVDVPAGEAHIEAMKGFEYRPAAATINVPAGGAADVTLKLARLVDAPAQGWYSGDTHIHDWHSGRWGLTQEDVVHQARAEDLHVTNVLVHMDDSRVMGRWSDVVGHPDPLSTPDFILYYSEEFRGALGHVGLLGLKRIVLPVLSGVPTTAYSADRLTAWALDQVHAQGGIGGYVHPYNSAVKKAADGAVAEIPINVALQKGDFYDVAAIWSDELASAEMYYRFLNCGFRLAATGGSDTPSNVWRAPPPGTDRTYARVSGRFTYDNWLAAIKAGRTFGTNGPLVFLDVDGKGPGEELQLSATSSPSLAVHAVAHSIVPLERLEIIVNGAIARTFTAANGATDIDGQATVTLPISGWIAARVIGPSHRYLADTFAFAQTTPVYVVRGGVLFTSAADAQFLLEVVDAVWQRVEKRNGWRNESDKAVYRDAVERAKTIYRQIAEQATRTTPGRE